MLVPQMSMLNIGHTFLPHGYGYNRISSTVIPQKEKIMMQV